MHQYFLNSRVVFSAFSLSLLNLDFFWKGQNILNWSKTCIFISLCNALQVEAALITSSYVDNIMVYVDPFHNYCVALVVPSHQALKKWAEDSGISHDKFSDLCNKTEAINEVQKSLSKVCSLIAYLKGVSLRWYIRYSLRLGPCGLYLDYEGCIEWRSFFFFFF